MLAVPRLSAPKKKEEKRRRRRSPILCMNPKCQAAFWAVFTSNRCKAHSKGFEDQTDIQTTFQISH